MLRCAIEWVSQESGWKPTPDTNEAIALVQAFDPRITAGMVVTTEEEPFKIKKLTRKFSVVEAQASYGRTGVKIDTAEGWGIPICEVHAKQLSPFWRLLPLPEQEEIKRHDLVKAQAPVAVLEAIINAWPDQCQEILKDLRWHGSFDSYWSFRRWGMFVGVEKDGYIHT